MRAKALQSSSSLLARLKWATEDRSAFFSAIEELSRVNDLLENSFRIKPSEDHNFLARGQESDASTHDFIRAIRASLEKLHRDLLVANPNGRDVEFSLKLELDGRDKESYADYIDADSDSCSAVYSLKTYLKTKHKNSDKSHYLLAETAISEEINVPAIKNIIAAVNKIDPDADPVFQCLGGMHRRLKTTRDSESTKTRHPTGHEHRL
jgi:hypothetical protein